MLSADLPKVRSEVKRRWEDKKWKQGGERSMSVQSTGM